MLRFLCLNFALCFSLQPLADAKPLKIFAAASLSEVLADAFSEWQSDNRVSMVFDSSSRLAKQIAAGAHADIFIPASRDWMDFLASKDLLVKSSRRSKIFTNELVMAVPTSSKNKGKDISTFNRIAVAGENVPAGRYGSEALKALKLWDGLKGALIRGHSVRSVLSWVAAGEVDAGIVYRSDVVASGGKARVIRVFDKRLHSEIVYPAAILRVSKKRDVAEKAIRFLQSPGLREVYRLNGFEAVKKP